MQPTALRALLTINVVLYVLWLLLFSRIEVTAAFFTNWLMLNATVPDILFRPWQLITYNFLHLGMDVGGLLHIVFNMLWLFWIGKEYEEIQGSQRLLAAYLFAGLGGGLLTVLLHAMLPGVSMFSPLVYGASASVVGVLTVVAVTYPYKSIALLFIGQVRLIHLVVGFLILDLVFVVLFGSSTSVSAHLGGAAFGYLFARGEAKGVDLSSWAGFFFPQRRSSRGRRGSRGASRSAPPSDASFLQRLEFWLSSREEKKDKPRRTQEPKSRPGRVYTMPRRDESEIASPAAHGHQSEVDRILDKISAQGMEALTEDERRILQDASRD